MYKLGGGNILKIRTVNNYIMRNELEALYLNENNQGTYIKPADKAKEKKLFYKYTLKETRCSNIT